MKYLLYIVAGLLGVWVGRKLAVWQKTRKSGRGNIESHNEAREEKMAEAKDKVMTLFEKQEKITNDDVENLLKVSDATARNYLNDLEKQGKIMQKGDAGRGVYYIINR